MIIYAINYDLDVVGLEMAMDSMEPMLGERATHGQPIARLGIVKNSPGLLDWTKKMFMCYLHNIA